METGYVIGDEWFDVEYDEEGVQCPECHGSGQGKDGGTCDTCEGFGKL